MLGEAREKALFGDATAWGVETKTQAATLRASSIIRHAEELAEESPSTRVSDATLRALKREARSVLDNHKAELQRRLARLASLQGPGDVKQLFTEKAGAAMRSVEEQRTALEEAFGEMGLAD